jgi:hypothetical protein
MPHDGNGKKYRTWTKGRRGREGLLSVHTNTTGRNVRSNHDWALAGLEFVQNPVTFILLLVTMNGYSTVSF